jgi:DeoR/GlpR family transcriptional regulator of sugar metabolism
MDYKTYTERLNYLLEMTEKGRVTSPLVIAEKYNCSEKTIRRMLNHLREAGHAIRYSKHSKKYLLTKK